LKIPEDPFILELLPEFLESWITDMDEVYMKHINEKNEQELYRLAHTLKGSCFQFGLDDLAEIGIKLMALARAHQWEEAKNYYKPLRDGFVEMQNFLNSRK
jgi:HPt (histidine-containing phosphotransfer) domain-containing protein